MKGDAKKLQELMKQRQAFTDHIFFVGEAVEDAPVITVGREKGYAIIGSGSGGGGGGEELLGQFDPGWNVQVQQFQFDVPAFDIPWTQGGRFAYLRLECWLRGFNSGFPRLILPGNVTQYNVTMAGGTPGSYSDPDGVIPLAPTNDPCGFSFRLFPDMGGFQGWGFGSCISGSPNWLQVPVTVSFQSANGMTPIILDMESGVLISSRAYLYGVR